MMKTAQMDGLKAGLVAAYDNHGYDVRSMVGRIAHEIARDPAQPDGLRDIMARLVIASAKMGWGQEYDGRRRRAQIENAQIEKLKKPIQ